MDFYRDYLPLLGSFVFDAPEERLRRWNATASEQQSAFLARLTSDGFAGIALQQLGAGALLADWVAATRLQMQREMIHAMRDEAALKVVYTLLEQGGIRHIPIKGIDLAYRIYPSPSMRHFGDWDLFFHPEDLDRARQLLIDNGWNELLKQDKEAHHHTSPLTKETFFLEPHWTLSGCLNSDPKAIWEYSCNVSGSQCRRVLSPEANVLLVARHAAADEYRFTNLTKMLLDAAYIILREGVDWNKLRNVAKTLNQPYPGNLFGAFPEFFPNDWIKCMSANPKQADAYREIFLKRKELTSVTGAEVLMQSENRFSARWLKNILRIFWPKNMRYKYELPPKGAYCRLLLCYPRECAHKIMGFFKCITHNQTPLKEYCKLIQKAEED